jgi:DNA-binding MarR family transcriptional regulator
MNNTDTERVQRAYPKIYLACHTRHVRAASTSFRLSSRDSSVLAHLSEQHAVTPSQLAAHLSVRSSTLSAAIKKLEKLGYLFRSPSPKDRRIISLLLTAHGAKAMAATSVLDSKRVAAVLAWLTTKQKARALKGLELFAQASMQSMAKNKTKGG